MACIEGSDPRAPTLLLMGHTDVVPVNEDDWQRDPFGGDLVDGEVWGRGAIDMLCITASMAVGLRELARSGWRPRGTVKLGAMGQLLAESLDLHEYAVRSRRPGSVLRDQRSQRYRLTHQ